MTKEIKTTLVTYEQFSDLDFTDPADYYIRLATGEYLYVHTKNRKIAQEFIDKEYGSHYTIRTGKMTKPKGLVEGHKYTAKG